MATVAALVPRSAIALPADLSDERQGAAIR